MRWPVGTLLVLGALCGATSPARAEEDEIQVLSVMSDDAFDEAQALTVALKRAATRAGWELDAGEYSLEVMVASFNCSEPPDDQCMKKIAGKINSDRFVWGTLDKQGSDLVAHLRLWRDGANTRDARFRYSANLTDPNDDALMKVAQSAVRKLSGAAPGTVVLRVGSIDGQVFVDGKRVGELEAGRAEFDLPAGEHQIRVTAEGYDDAAGVITVHPGMSVELPMTPRESGSGATPSAKRAEESPGPGLSTRRMVGYGAIGAGGLLGLGGLLFTLKIDSTNRDKGFQEYKRGFRGDQDACTMADRGVDANRSGAISPAEAADKCSSASTAEVLQWVFYGLGAAAVGGGAYLLMTEPDDGDSAGRLGLRAGLGRHGGAVQMRLAF